MLRALCGGTGPLVVRREAQSEIVAQQDLVFFGCDMATMRFDSARSRFDST